MKGSPEHSAAPRPNMLLRKSDHHETRRLGIDLGGTKIEIVALNPAGQIESKHRFDTPHQNYDRILDQLITAINWIDPEPQSPVLPVGIGTPGSRSTKTGLMKNSNTTALNNRDLLGDLEHRSGRAIRIANDADCFTLSEAIDGAGADNPTVFGVILGTGVGGGITVNQKLLSGPNGIAGEWGHNPLPLHRLDTDFSMPLDEGRACYCGQTDCIETWLSGPGVSHSYGLLSERSLPAKDIFASRRHDSLAQKVFETYCELAALALSGVINILDPHCVVLGGGLSNAAEICDEITRRWHRYIFSDQIHTLLLRAQHGDASGVRGAAWLW